MCPARPIRVLTVVALAIALQLVPVVATAAPERGEPGSRPSIVETLWEWVSSLWDAGGGGFDPTNRQASSPPEPTTTPTAVPPAVVENPVLDAGGDRSTERFGLRIDRRYRD